MGFYLIGLESLQQIISYLFLSSELVADFGGAFILILQKLPTRKVLNILHQSVEKLSLRLLEREMRDPSNGIRKSSLLVLLCIRCAARAP